MGMCLPCLGGAADDVVVTPDPVSKLTQTLFVQLCQCKSNCPASASKTLLTTWIDANEFKLTQHQFYVKKLKLSVGQHKALLGHVQEASVCLACVNM